MTLRAVTPRAPKPEAPEVPGLPRAARRCFPALMAGEALPASWFRAEVDRHLEETRAAARRREFVDLALAERVAAGLHALLAALDHDTPDAHRRAVYGAARYFVQMEDGEHDLESEIGFHDDAEVLNAVARFVGRADLVISLP